MVKDPANVPGKLNMMITKSPTFSFNKISTANFANQEKPLNLNRMSDPIKPVNVLTKQSKPMKIQSNERKPVIQNITKTPNKEIFKTIYLASNHNSQLLS